MKIPSVISRFIHRLNVCRAWQWRTGVLTRDVVKFIDGIGAVLVFLVSGAAGLIMIPFGLLAMLWRFTGGVLYHAITASGSTIAELEAALPHKKDPQATGPTPECEESVIEKIRVRRDAGRQKYGTTMERSDLTRRQWLQHAQEEAMDLAIYLERLIREDNAADK